MPSQAGSYMGSECGLIPTLQIHARNPLLNMHPGPSLWIGLSTINRIPLKSGLVVFGRITIDVGVQRASKHRTDHQKTQSGLKHCVN